MEIEFFEKPNIEDINFLTKKINEETVKFGLSHPFAFFIKNNKNLIIAGANGFIIYGVIYTDQLWVDPKYRNKGLAKSIMKKTHELGLQSGCKLATIQTMSFQNAKAFYEKLGYQTDFERNGYSKSSSCLFLKKNLT